MRLVRTWHPREPENPLPPLPDELAERPGMVWLYLCSKAGLTTSDLQGMRIDQAEAWIELHEFINDAVTHQEEDAKNRESEEAFWNL